MRPATGRILLVLGSILFTLVAVDGILLLWHGPVRVVENFYEPDARFGYRMRPRLDFEFASPYHGYRASVHTNALGLRDDEIVVPKPPGTFRILLLGDSMTAGLEVEKGQTLEAVSEALLRRGGAVEVINAGVRGYNLDNIAGFLYAVGFDLQPDVVVYVFVDNDLTGDADFRPEGGDVSRGFSMRGVLGRLATWSHVSYRLELLREMLLLRWQRDHGGPPATTAYLHGGLFQLFTSHDYETEPKYLRTEARIRAMAERCAARGAVFVLVGAPHREEIDLRAQAYWSNLLQGRVQGLDFDGVSRFLAWVAERDGLPRLDPVPAFRRDLARERNFWFHEDNHLNVAGHRLLGTLLAERIQSLPKFEAWRTAHAARP